MNIFTLSLCRVRIAKFTPSRAFYEYVLCTHVSNEMSPNGRNLVLASTATYRCQRRNTILTGFVYDSVMRLDQEIICLATRDSFRRKQLHSSKSVVETCAQDSTFWCATDEVPSFDYNRNLIIFNMSGPHWGKRFEDGPQNFKSYMWILIQCSPDSRTPDCSRSFPCWVQNLVEVRICVRTHVFRALLYFLCQQHTNIWESFCVWNVSEGFDVFTL
jgi:hypothetical protein